MVSLVQRGVVCALIGWCLSSTLSRKPLDSAARCAGGGGFLHERPRLALISGKRAVDASGPTLRLVEPASLFEKQIMFATVNTNIPFGREEAHRYGMENRVHASTWRSTNQLLCHDLSSCLMRQTGNPQNFQGGVIPFKHSLRRISESLL